jgi:hypothetical protein
MSMMTIIGYTTSVIPGKLSGYPSPSHFHDLGGVRRDPGRLCVVETVFGCCFPHRLRPAPHPLLSEVLAHATIMGDRILGYGLNEPDGFNDYGYFYVRLYPNDSTAMTTSTGASA